MTRKKIFLLALAAIPVLFTCEKVPDYCGKGAWYDPNVQFCFSGKAFNQCGGSSYNPLTQGCIQGVEIGTLCADGSAVKLGTPCNGYILTTTATPEFGGSVTHTPADRTTFAAGEQVVVSAVPEDKYKFVGWAGADVPQSQSVTIVMNANKPMVAMFQIIDDPNAATRTLVTTAFPENGGTISRNPDAEMYTPRTSVTVTATAAQGYRFGGWSGAITSPNASVTVTMDESKTLVAMFTPVVYTLTVNANPTEGGTVFINGTALAGTTTQDFGTEVDVEAKAAGGYGFTGWSGTAAFGDVGSAKTTVTLGGDATITANFRHGGGTVTPPVVTPPTGGGSDTLVDSRDGQKYRTVKIGDQTWMAENLNYDTASGAGSWCYENDKNNCDKYGRLYNWNTAMAGAASSSSKVRGVCPSGWHLPSLQEWETLVDYAGGSSVAGKKLKSTTDWNAYSGITATDDFGFSALPSGYRNNDGSFSSAGNGSYWWTATEGGSGNAYNRFMFYGLDNVHEYNSSKDYGFSARCLKDESTTPTSTKYAVTVSSAGTGATSNGSYAAGETVSISAGTPPVGQQFKNWTTASNGVRFADANRETTTFIMPGNAVTVTAVFAASFTDSRDSKVYKTVKIGNQTWMAENLNVVTENSWCCGEGGYDYSSGSGKTLSEAEVQVNCNKYGRLYTWDAAKKACPTGWHLPSRQEWQTLVDYTGGSSVAGKKLKSTTDWNAYSGITATDDFGFSALPGGYYAGGGFDTAGNNGYWWTATENDSDYAYDRDMYYNYDRVNDSGSHKYLGYSVRCLKD